MAKISPVGDNPKKTRAALRTAFSQFLAKDANWAKFGVTNPSEALGGRDRKKLATYMAKAYEDYYQEPAADFLARARKTARSVDADAFDVKASGMKQGWQKFLDEESPMAEATQDIKTEVNAEAAPEVAAEAPAVDLNAAAPEAAAPAEAEAEPEAAIEGADIKLRAAEGAPADPSAAPEATPAAADAAAATPADPAQADPTELKLKPETEHGPINFYFPQMPIPEGFKDREHMALAGSMRGPMALGPGTMALLTGRFGGYDFDPAFIESLSRKAAEKGVSLEEFLSTEGKTPAEISAKQAEVFQVYAASSALMTDPTDNFDARYKLSAVEVKKKSLLARSLSGIDTPDVIFYDSLKDANGAPMPNRYIDNGKSVGLVLKKGQKFGAEHALNLARIYVAGRLQNPQESGGQQVMEFQVSSAKGAVMRNLGNLKHALGAHSEHEFRTDLLMISCLHEAERMNVTPKLSVKDNGLKAKVSIDEIHPDARMQLLAKGIDVDGLIDRYNKGWPAEPAVKIEGQDATLKQATPAPQAPEPNVAAKPVTATTNPADILAAAATTAKAGDIKIPAPAADAGKPATAADILLKGGSAEQAFGPLVLKPEDRITPPPAAKHAARPVAPSGMG